jgi:hypothetical protein
VNRLYYPNVIIDDLTIGMGMLQAVATTTVPNLAIQDFMVTLKLNGQSDDVQNVAPEWQYQDLLQEMGKGLYVQCRDGPENPQSFNAEIGTMFQVLGLVGVEYEFEGQFFKDGGIPIGEHTRGHFNSCPLAPMHYTDLKVGAPCWMTITDDHARWDNGTYRGTITKIPDSIYPVLKLHCLSNEAMRTLLLNGASTAPQRKSLAERNWILSTTAERVNAAIHANIKIQLGATLDTIGAEAHTVYLARNRNTGTQVVIRRPNQYIYTPNQMFWMFNKPELYKGTAVNLPYKIQTDVNGGFGIYWSAGKKFSTEGVVHAESRNFRISVDLSEALGLNPFFEYDYESLIGTRDFDMIYLQKVNYNPLEDVANPTVWLPRGELSVAPVGNWTPVLDPVQKDASGAPTKIYDSLDNQYYFIQQHSYSENIFETVSRKIFPALRYDSDNVAYYEYDNLPEIGRIYNNQMVSVESFSTYSEITIVVPNLPFQSMLGTASDERILASLRLPFDYGTTNNVNGEVSSTAFSFYGDLIYNTLASRSYLKVTTDQSLYDCDVEVRLIRRDGEMDVMKLPYQGEFQVKLRLLQTQ